MPDHFKINKNSELGRYSRATKDIVAGEIVFEEHPFVVGPKPNTPPVCLGCSYPVDGSATGPRCPHCRWPLCENCVDNDLHRNECNLFVKNNVIFHDFSSCEDACMQLDCITPLRLLLEKELNPKRWDEEICLMEHHRSIRYKSEQWNADHHNIVRYLIGTCKLKGRFSEELIQQACGILEVNSFEARTKYGGNVRCIYPKTAIMAHSCVPNTTHSIYPSNGFKIKVRASIEISDGGMLYTTYTNLLDGTAIRQKHLKESKFFTCRCNRCRSATELETHFSSIKCNECHRGFVCVSDPFDLNSAWKCTFCGWNTKTEAIDKALSIIQTEVEQAQSIVSGSERLEQYEILIRKYRKVLHPRHYIITGLRQNLIELYGRVDGYELQEMTDILLKHKIGMCLDVLKVLNVIYPGKTRAHAMLLYEMHGPLVLSSRNAYIAGILKSDGFKTKLREAINLLEECIEILEWEDVATMESDIAQIAKKVKAQLTEEIIKFENRSKSVWKK